MKKIQRWFLALLAILAVFAGSVSQAAITISAAPDASSLVDSLETSYGLFVGLGFTVGAIGLLWYLLRRGVKVK